MQATRIIAIRHGETAWNVDTRIQGQLNVELNETGRWQAGRVAQALADETIAAIYASDLLRAWETARSIAERNRMRHCTPTRACVSAPLASSRARLFPRLK
jgi:probable phosphoglycerate mutase